MESGVRSQCPLEERITTDSVINLIRKNSETNDRIKALIDGIGVLEKYGCNLLKAEEDRPAVWKAVKFSNAVFKNKVDCLQDARKVLTDLGYTVMREDGQGFPDHALIDRNNIAKILCDLQEAKTMLQKHLGGHPEISEFGENNITNDARFKDCQQMNTIQPARSTQSMYWSSMYDTVKPASTLPPHYIHGVGNSSEDYLHLVARPPTTLLTEGVTTEVCDICGQTCGAIHCEVCDNKILCVGCDEKWHQHPKRLNHTRTTVKMKPVIAQKPTRHTSQPRLSNVTTNFVPDLPTFKTMRDTSIVRAVPPLPEKPAHLRSKKISSSSSAGSLSPETASYDEVYAFQRQLSSSVFRPGSDYTSIQYPPTITQKLSVPSQNFKMATSPPDQPFRSVSPTFHLFDVCQYCGQATDYALDRCSYCHQEIPVAAKETLRQLIMNSRQTLQHGQQFGSVPANLNVPRYPQQNYHSQQFQQQQPQPKQIQFQTLRQQFQQQLIGQQPQSQGQQFQTLGQQLQQPQFQTPQLLAQQFQPRQQQQQDPTIPAEQTPEKKDSEEGWHCSFCTYANPYDSRICSMCGKTNDWLPTPKPKKLDLKKEPAEQFQTHRAVEDQAKVQQALTGGPATSPKSATLPSKSSLEPEKKLYKSLFVDIQDDIAREKKEAHERFRKQLELEEMERKNLQESRQEKSSSLYPQQKSATLGGAGDKKLEGVPSSLRKVSTLPVKMPSQYSSPPNSLEKYSFGSDLANIENRKRQENLITDGKWMIKMMRNVLNEGLDLEALTLAVSQDNNDPIKWLKNEFPDIAATVQQMVMAQVPNAKISIAETKNALVKYGGNINMAADRCIRDRKQQVKEIREMAGFEFEEEAVQEALMCNHGDVMEAVMQLQQLYIIQPVMDQFGIQPAPQKFAPSDPQFQKLLADKNVDLERRVRLVLAEGCVKSWGRAMTVVKLLDMEDKDFKLVDIIEAVCNTQGDVNNSLNYLEKECGICFDILPMSKMTTLSICECRLCFECMKRHFELVISDKHVIKLVCPTCGLPDIEDPEVANTYLPLLASMLKGLIAENVHALLERKLRDWHLMKDPNFRWCTHCDNGFIWAPEQGQLMMTCTHCNQKSCFKCRKDWEEQHQGLTCEQFKQWKEDNDPDSQAAGVAKILAEDGIECPQCKYRYLLAKGGCMHFKCNQCGHEFCSGCNNPFKRQENCRKLASCQRAGLHCHHPRDCLSYLRDRDIKELQQLLTKNKVNFDTKAPKGNTGTCQLREQKEDDGKLVDDLCGKPVENDSAGLCNLHFKEYLVSLINKHGIDPVTLMNVDELKNQLLKEGKPVPQKAPNQKHYKQLLLETVRKEIPLPVRAANID